MKRRERMKNPHKYRDFEVTLRDGSRNRVWADNLEQVKRVFKRHFLRVVMVND